MKLKSVYIEKYKNLSPLTIDFELGNGLTMLVGNNGSGKSNVLEAISGIFHDLFKGKDSRKIKCDSSSAALTQKYIDSLSLDLLDDECVESAKVMATVYTAIAAFENMVRQFVVKILMENKGENWWTECVSDKIRKSADSRKAEEDKIKWHTHRGTSMINYVDFADLANIMGQNYDLFEVHIVSLEWAKQIFTTLEKSRNVIMHSGELGERDIERIGINIRDWISQVGA